MENEKILTKLQIKQKEYYQKNKDKKIEYAKMYQQTTKYLKWLLILPTN